MYNFLSMLEYLPRLPRIHGARPCASRYRNQLADRLFGSLCVRHSVVTLYTLPETTIARLFSLWERLFSRGCVTFRECNKSSTGVSQGYWKSPRKDRISLIKAFLRHFDTLSLESTLPYPTRRKGKSPTQKWLQKGICDRSQEGTPIQA